MKSFSDQFQLGQLYYYGGLHSARDYKKAFKYFNKSQLAFDFKKQMPKADQMNENIKTKIRIAAMSYGHLGFMYWRGEGVKQDTKTAREFFEKGVKVDGSLSMYGLGLMHLEGAAGFQKVCIFDLSITFVFLISY